MAIQNDPLTPDMILKQMSEIVANTKLDLFRIRVSRRDNPQALVPKVIATLEGASLDHLQSPETWLSQLAGGGHYFLTATHKSNATSPFPPLQVVMAGDMRQPDPYADSRPTWRGPSEIVIPEKQRAQTDDQGGSSYAPLLVGPVGPMGTPPRNGAPQGSGPTGFTSPVQTDVNLVERMRLQQAQDELARRERSAAEERHRQELDLIKRGNELEIAKLRADMTRSQQPQGDTVIDKMLMLMREEAKQREEREETRRREEREREDRRLEAERVREERRLGMEREDRKEREAERQRLEERLAAERKAADDRFLQLMNERQNAGAEMMKLMAPVSEMMGTSMNVVVQALHSIAELNQPAGEPEPPYFKLVGKIVDGIKAAAEAARDNTRVRMPPTNMRRPAPSTPPPLAQPPSPPQPPQPPPRPVAVVPEPSPSPPAAVAAFNGVEITPTPRKRTAFEALIEMIKAQEDPEKVARFFYENIKARSIAVELTAHDMQIVATFAPHLLPWLKDDEARQAYMKAVFAKVQEIGIQMGAVEAVNAPEGEEEEEEEDNEGEEEKDEEEEEAGGDFDDAETGEEDITPPKKEELE